MICLVALMACAEPPVAAPEPDPVVAEVHQPDTRVVMVAVGDVLPHRRVKQSARDHGWAAVFSDTADLLRGADISFANLESPVAPDVHLPLHGEVFNAPASLLQGLVDAGVDVVSLANNHAYDQGAAGLAETHRRATEAGLVAVGAGPTCADALAARVVDVEGIRIAFLAVADLVNIDGNTSVGAPCLFTAGPVCTAQCGPDRDAVHFSLDTESLVATVQQARGEADLVVLSFHWGDEYRTDPLPEYPKIAQVLVDAGVDVLLGHHPHVLQPVRRVRSAEGRDAIVAFSLGNFVSDMGRTFDTTTTARSGRTRDGAMLAIEIRMPPGGPATVGETKVIPTWTDNQPDRIAVRTHSGLRSEAPELVERRRGQITDIIDVELLSDTLP